MEERLVIKGLCLQHHAWYPGAAAVGARYDGAVLVILFRRWVLYGYAPVVGHGYLARQVQTSGTRGAAEEDDHGSIR